MGEIEMMGYHFDVKKTILNSINNYLFKQCSRTTIEE